jgi:SOS-response transcriptional repressor LexA
LGLTEDEFFQRPNPRGKHATVDSDSNLKIPLFGEIPAGAPSPKDGKLIPDQWLDVPSGIRNPKVFALKVQGDSMSPRLLPGDIVFLEPLQLHLGPKDPEQPAVPEPIIAPQLLFERLQGRIVAALLDGEATLKVLHIASCANKTDYELHLLPVNPEYRPILIQPSMDVYFQGVVVKTQRDETAPLRMPL